MEFKFNEKKAAQEAAYLLARCGGTLPYIALIKLMYLADRKSLLAHGQLISGDRLVSMKKGPVLSTVLDLIRQKKVGVEWGRYVTAPVGFDVSSTNIESATDELSPFELEILDSIVSEFGSKDRWALVEFVHGLPEWHDPGNSSADISPEEILKLANVSEEVISEYESAAAEMALLTA